MSCTQDRQSLRSISWLCFLKLLYWRCALAALCLGFPSKTHLSDIGKVAVPLSIVNAVADHKFILNAEPDPIGLNIYFAPRRFVEQCDGFHPRMVSLSQQAGHMMQRKTGIHDIFHNQNVSILNCPA